MRLDGKNLLIGTVLFGSLWGVFECTVGDYLHFSGLPAGIIMSGFFAFTLLIISRLLYKQPGMQVGMGLVAGVMRYFNPFGGCILCSSIAIIAEGLIFEIIWYLGKLEAEDFSTLRMKVSSGVVIAYLCYIGGYMVTQVVTPLVSTGMFYLPSFLAFIPNILGKGIWAALIGGFILPMVTSIRLPNISKIKEKMYYRIAIPSILVCWFLLILDSLLFA